MFHVIASIAPYTLWKYHAQCSNTDDLNKNDELVHVHMFHRHGHRTPWYSITQPENEKEIWIPQISKQYNSYDLDKHEPLVPHHQVHSWKNIASKLKGTSLAYKHDNWNSYVSPINVINIHQTHNMANCSQTLILIKRLYIVCAFCAMTLCTIYRILILAHNHYDTYNHHQRY